MGCCANGSALESNSSDGWCVQLEPAGAVGLAVGQVDVETSVADEIDSERLL